VNVMTTTRDPNLMTDGIDGREARFLTWLVAILLTPRADKAEFKQDLDSLVSAAEALSSKEGCSDHDGRAESEVDGAVLALWRTYPPNIREETRKAHNEATSLVGLHRASCSGTKSADQAELARAVDEIKRAMAALLDEGTGATEAVENDPSRRRRPVWVLLEIAGLWISIAAATLGMVAALIIFMR
jgi:hypothetical protein